MTVVWCWVNWTEDFCLGNTNAHPLSSGHGPPVWFNDSLNTASNSIGYRYVKWHTNTLRSPPHLILLLSWLARWYSLEQLQWSFRWHLKGKKTGSFVKVGKRHLVELGGSHSYRMKGGGKGSFRLAGYTWNTNWSFNCPNFASQRPAPNSVVPVLKRKDTLTSGGHTARSSAVAAKTRNSPAAMFTALNTSCDSRASFWSVDLAGA